MRRILLSLLLVAGCSIPDSQFKPSTDGGNSDSGNPDVLAIVPSATGITVDEDGNQQFSVTLSRAPSAPLTVKVETTSTKLGLSVPQFDFTETNFAMPQTVTVTGLADPDVADEVTEITLSADGVESVKVSTTIHDVDTLELVTDIAANNLVTLDEGQSVDVKVHLSHQPGADVSVMAILGSGPVTVMPSTLVFTPQSYDTDQTLRFTAAIDPNITTDDQPLTLRMEAVDKLYTVRSVDKDILNISVTPSSLAINEQGGAGNLNVALTQQPTANVVVMVATMSGHITTDKSQLTFTPQNYATNQTIAVNAPDDVDTEDDTDKVTLSTTTPGVMPREVTVSINDNDSQQILEDVPGTLAVAENGTVQFGVTLRFKPSGTVNVSVTSLASGVATASPGVLAFDQNNYNVPKLVTVQGTDDNNLAANSTTIRMFESTIGMTDVPVNVTDDDQQRIVVSASTVIIPEGTMGGFDVRLMYDPGTTVSATVMNTNSTALPSSPAMLTFTTANYNQAHPVTVSPPIDTNNVSETATFTISGAGAAMPATVMATAMDGTAVQTWGWPTPFPGTLQIPAGFVIAYKLDVGAVANLNTFHAFIPAAAGTFKMALYTDVNNAPGTLVPNAEMLQPKVLVNGVNNSNPLAMPPLLDAPAYWLAIRFSQASSIGYAGPMQTGRQCTRNVNIPDITSPWPVNWGTSACAVDNLFNIWITTYHQ